MDVNVDVSAKAPLTRREREVLALVAGGLTRQQVADQLCRSLHTVDAHLDHILKKLEALNTAHAVSTGVAGGWLSISRKFIGMLLVVSALSFADDAAIRPVVRPVGQVVRGRL